MFVAKISDSLILCEILFVIIYIDIGLFIIIKGRNRHFIDSLFLDHFRNMLKFSNLRKLVWFLGGEVILTVKIRFTFLQCEVL